MPPESATSGIPAAPADGAGGVSSPLPPWGFSSLLFGVYLLVVVIEYTGLGSQVPLLRAARVPTLLGWGLLCGTLVFGGWRDLVRTTQGRLLLLFLFFTGISVFWALVRTYVATDFRAHLGYLGLFLAPALLLDRHARLRRLAAVVSLVIIALVARNVDMLASEWRVGSFRAGYFLGDGNDFAWGLLTLLPFPLYLALQRQSLVVRPLGLLAGAVALAGIIGTGSRGAALAIAGAGLYYWLAVSRRKTVGAVVLAVIAVGVLALAPARYLDRVRTIATYQEDTSALGRLRAWRAAAAMAVDHPLGVGASNFNSVYGRYYLPSDATGWGGRRWISAHSVYFKVLGEYGFPGLILLLTIIGTNLRHNRAAVRRLRARPDGVASDWWPAMVNLGVVGYAVAGLFLGGIAYPHLYLLSGLTVAARRLPEHVKAQGTATRAAEAEALPPPPWALNGASATEQTVRPRAVASVQPRVPMQGPRLLRLPPEGGRFDEAGDGA